MSVFIAHFPSHEPHVVDMINAVTGEDFTGKLTEHGEFIGGHRTVYRVVSADIDATREQLDAFVAQYDQLADEIEQREAADEFNPDYSGLDIPSYMPAIVAVQRGDVITDTLDSLDEFTSIHGLRPAR